MVNARWREQYEDAVSTHFRAQERRPLAGLEADRQTAVALSEQKAEEAKLIKPGRKDFTRCWHCSAKLLPVAFIGKGQRACR